MVDDRLRDGRRIAELLASELDGLGDALARVAVTDADRTVEPTPDGAHAYRVTRRGDAGTGSNGETGDGDDRDLAVVFVQPDRARVEFTVVPDVAAERGKREGLRVRPKASRPPRTLVFVEDGAEVKRAVAVFEAVVAALDDEG
ncbi:hypothetical protein [Salinigranum sp.]|uniref:hypothetical protein n=1 Tax=Salinigranum sp. TaxID=1966351 RepID=UPI003565F1B9